MLPEPTFIISNLHVSWPEDCGIYKMISLNVPSSNISLRSVIEAHASICAMRLQHSLKSRLALLISISGLATARSSQASFDKSHYATSDIIIRDVLVVGGGASGTYAAVRLQQDFNKSVVLVEQKPTLGGHTNTYHDTASNTTVDFGVMVYHHLPLVHAFFDRFKIPLTSFTFGTSIISNVDFRTGQPVDVPSNPNDTAAAFAQWAAHLAQYPSLKDGFILPDPVPEDLLLSFHRFVDKYNLSAIVPSIWGFGQGYGDILNAPTLYALKLFGPEILRGISNGFVTTLHRNNHELYERALDVLGNDTNVFLKSNILAVTRNRGSEFSTAVLSTPSGYKLVEARQILFTIPPMIDRLRDIDLDETEIDLFSQFQGNGYFTALLENASVAENTTITNRADNPANFYLPRLPTTYTIGTTFTRSNLTSAKFGTSFRVKLGAVQTQIVSETRRVILGSRPQMVTLVDHAPFGLQVSARAIKRGFYRKLYQLQGRDRYFWSGAAWHVHDSSLLWNFTETVLAQMQPVLG